MLIDALSNALIGTLCFTNPLLEKIKFRYKLIMFVFSFIFSCILYGTPYTAVAIIPFNLLIVILFSNNKAMNGIAALVGYISSVWVNNLMLVILEKTLHIELTELLSNSFNLTIFYICFLIVVYIVTTLTGKLFKRFMDKSDFARSPSTLVLVFVQLLLCAAILVFNITYARQLGYPQNTILFNCVLFFIYFILSSLLLINIVSSTKKNLQMQQELEEAKQLREYTETIEYHASKMREFKHDYLNVLLTLDELIHKSHDEKLISYFDEQIKPTGQEIKHIDTGLIALKHIGDTAVKSILYNKLSFALSKGIKLHLLLDFDIPDFSIKSMDLAKLLGIFLDNAIEAALTCKEPVISVVFTKDKTITLEISNNFSGDAPDLFRISEKGYSTKGDNRGLGLTQAEAIMDKYPELVHSVNIENNLFLQSISSL